MLAYLAGAIEYAPDHGRAWRKEIAPFLRDELRHDVYDPAEDERKSLTLEEQQNLRPLEEAWQLGNRFGLVPMVLPIGIENPLERLYKVRDRMLELKGSYQPILALGLVRLLHPYHCSMG